MTRSLLDRDITLNMDEGSRPKRSASVSAVRKDAAPSLLFTNETVDSPHQSAKRMRNFPADEDRVFFPTNQISPIGQGFQTRRSNLQSAPSSQQGQLITTDLYSNGTNAKIDPFLLQKRIEKKKELEQIYSVESNVKKLLIPSQQKRKPQKTRSQSTKPGSLPRISSPSSLWERPARKSPRTSLSNVSYPLFTPSPGKTQLRSQSQADRRAFIQPSFSHSFDDDDIDFEHDFRDDSSNKNQTLSKKDSFDFEEQEFEIGLSDSTNIYLSPNNDRSSQFSERASQGDRRRSIGSMFSTRTSAVPSLSPVQQTHRVSMKKNQLDFLEKNLDLKKRQESQLDLAIRIQKRQLQLLRRRLKIHQEKEAASKAAMEKYQTMGDPNNLLAKIDEGDKLLRSKEKRLQTLAADLQAVQKMSEEKEVHLNDLEQSLKGEIESIQQRLEQLKNIEKDVEEKQREASRREGKIESLESELRKNISLNEKKSEEISRLEGKLQNDIKLNEEAKQNLRTIELALQKEKENLDKEKANLMSEKGSLQDNTLESRLPREEIEKLQKTVDELRSRERLYETLLAIGDEEKSTLGDRAIESKIQKLNEWKQRADAIIRIGKATQVEYSDFCATRSSQTETVSIVDSSHQSDMISLPGMLEDGLSGELQDDTSRPASQYHDDLQSLRDAVISSGDNNAKLILSHINDERKFMERADKLEKDLIALQIQHQQEFDRMKEILHSKDKLDDNDLAGLREISKGVQKLGLDYQSFSDEIERNVDDIGKGFGPSTSPSAELLIEKKRGLVSKVASMKKLIDSIYERDESDISALVDGVSSKRSHPVSQELLTPMSTHPYHTDQSLLASNTPSNPSQPTPTHPSSTRPNPSASSSSQQIETRIDLPSPTSNLNPAPVGGKAVEIPQHDDRELDHAASKEENAMLLRGIDSLKFKENNTIPIEVKSLCEDSERRAALEKEKLNLEADARRKIRDTLSKERGFTDTRTDAYKNLTDASIRSMLAKLEGANLLSKNADSSNSNVVLSDPLQKDLDSLRTLKESLKQHLEALSMDSQAKDKADNDGTTSVFEDIIKRIEEVEANESKALEAVLRRNEALKSDLQDLLQQQKRRLEEKSSLDSDKHSNHEEYKKKLQQLDEEWSSFVAQQIENSDKAKNDFSLALKSSEDIWQTSHLNNLEEQKRVSDELNNEKSHVEERCSQSLESIPANLSPGEKDLSRIEILQQRQNDMNKAEEKYMKKMKTLASELLDAVENFDMSKNSLVEKLNHDLDTIDRSKEEKISELLALEKSIENDFATKESDINKRDQEMDVDILRRIAELENQQLLIEKERQRMHEDLENQIRSLQSEIYNRPALKKFGESALGLKEPYPESENTHEKYSPENVAPIPVSRMSEGETVKPIQPHSEPSVSPDDHGYEKLSREELANVIASTKFSAATLDFLSNSLEGWLKRSGQLEESHGTDIDNAKPPPQFTDFEISLDDSENINIRNLLEDIELNKKRAESIQTKIAEIKDIEDKKINQYRQELDDLKSENQKKIEEAQKMLEKFNQLELDLAKTREDASVVEAEMETFSKLKQEYEDTVKALQESAREKSIEFDELQKKLQQEEGTTKSITEQLDESTKLVNELQQKIEKEKEEIATLKEQHEVSSNTVKELEQKLQEENGVVQNLLKEKEESEKIISELNDIATKHDESQMIISSEREKSQELQNELDRVRERDHARQHILQSVDGVIKLKEELQSREQKLLDEEQNLASRIQNQNELVARFEAKMREEREELNDRLQNLIAREEELELLYSKLTARLNDVRVDSENNFIPLPRVDMSQTVTSLGTVGVSEKRIIYLSQMVSVVDCEAIVNESNLYNRDNSIAGILICSEYAFVHMIEGNSRSVDALYRKIIQDRRHQDIHCIKVENDTPYRLCNSPMRLVKTSSNLLSTGASDLSSFSANSPSNRRSPTKSSMQSPSNRFSTTTSSLGGSPNKFSREDLSNAQPLLQLFDSILTSFRHLEKYVPPPVINLSKSSINPLILPVLQHERIIMLVDVVHFAVKLRADEARSLMAKYLSITRKCVTKYHGDVLQYTGNAVIAVFDQNQASDALKATHLLYKTILAKMPLDSSNRNAPLVQLGVTLTQGEVLEGSFGCGAQMTYQIVGENVQRAWQISSQLFKQKYLFVFDNSIRAALKREESIFEQQAKHIGTIQIQNSRTVELYSIPSNQIFQNTNQTIYSSSSVEANMQN